MSKGFFNFIFGIFSLFTMNAGEMFTRQAVSPAVQKVEVTQKPESTQPTQSSFQPF